MKKKFMTAVLSTLLLIGSMAGCGKADLNDRTDQSSVAGEMSDYNEETDTPEEQSEEDNSSLGGMEGTARQPDHAESIVYMTTDISSEGIPERPAYAGICGADRAWEPDIPVDFR